MIKTEFYISEGGYPVFKTELAFEMLWELGSCKKEYIDEIVRMLDEIKNDTLKEYYFGYERTGITCNSKFCSITDDFENVELRNVAFEDIYNLMVSWKKYYDDWEVLHKS